MDPYAGAEINEDRDIVLHLGGGLVEVGNRVTRCDRATGIANLHAPCSGYRIELFLGYAHTAWMKAPLMQ